MRQTIVAVTKKKYRRETLQSPRPTGPISARQVLVCHKAATAFDLGTCHIENTQALRRPPPTLHSSTLANMSCLRMRQPQLASQVSFSKASCATHLVSTERQPWHPPHRACATSHSSTADPHCVALRPSFCSAVPKLLGIIDVY